MGKLFEAVIAEINRPRATRQPQSTCIVGRFIATLDEEDTTAFEQILGNPEYPTVTISKALKSQGQPMSEASVRRHRQRDCVCVSAGA